MEKYKIENKFTEKLKRSFDRCEFEKIFFMGILMAMFLTLIIGCIIDNIEDQKMWKSIIKECPEAVGMYNKILVLEQGVIKSSGRFSIDDLIEGEVSKKCIIKISGKNRERECLIKKEVFINAVKLGQLKIADVQEW